MSEQTVPGDEPTSYVTPDQVREVLEPGGVPDVGSASEMGDPELQDAINDAQTEVDGRLAPLYGTSVPFQPPVPAIIQSITRDIAAWLATLVHRNTSIEPTEPLQLRYNRAQAMLQQIQTGAIDLGIRDPTTGQAQETEMVDMVVNPDQGEDMFTLDDVGLTVSQGKMVPAQRWPQSWGEGGGPYP